MRKIYELDEAGKFVGDFILLTDNDALPPNWTGTPLPMPCITPRFVGDRNDETGEWTGNWVDDGIQPLTPQQQEFRERIWRNAELGRADIELNKVQDGMGRGTVSQWREYRCSLRDWPENQDFPDSTKRPVAPDA